MIPYYDGRVGPGLDVLGQRTLDEDYSKILPSLKRPHLEYFREFYGDTAMFGGGAHALRCGFDFFGADKVVFATDTPLGPIKPAIDALNALDISAFLRKRRKAAEEELGCAVRLARRARRGTSGELAHVRQKPLQPLIRPAQVMIEQRGCATFPPTRHRCRLNGRYGLSSFRVSAEFAAIELLVGALPRRPRIDRPATERTLHRIISLVR